MIDVSYGEVLEGRQRIANRIFAAKQRQEFSVIDVGGSATGWSVPVVDCFVDINKCDTTKPQFNIDITNKSSWDELVAVLPNKFDYCICTHTLEDIYNPYLVLDYLPKIARAGIITMPSIRTELSHVESEHWLGFFHHRYLFGVKDDKMVVAPKLPIVEKLRDRPTTRIVEEIRFEWRYSIEYEVFMSNYLGPTTDTVLKNYERFIGEHI